MSEEKELLNTIRRIYGDSKITEIFSNNIYIRNLGREILRQKSNSDPIFSEVQSKYKQKITKDRQTAIRRSQQMIIDANLQSKQETDFSNMAVFYAYTNMLRCITDGVYDEDLRLRKYNYINKLQILAIIDKGIPLIFFNRGIRTPHPAIAEGMPTFNYRQRENGIASYDDLLMSEVSFPVKIGSQELTFKQDEEQAHSLLIGSYAIRKYISTLDPEDTSDVQYMRYLKGTFGSYDHLNDSHDLISGPIDFSF